MSKLTEEDIKLAFREALMNNIDRLYEDFKSRFSNTARRNSLPSPPLLPPPRPALTSGKRARSTKNGLAKLYARHLSNEPVAGWTRSEQHYVSLAFATDNVWKKAIQLVFALSSMRRKYSDGSRTPPISLGQHGVLDDAVKALQNLIEKLLKEDESSTPVEMNEQLDTAAIDFIDALLLYNKDCYIRDSFWPARYAPTCSGQQLLAASRDGEEASLIQKEVLIDNEPNTSKDLQARGERRLRALGL